MLLSVSPGGRGGGVILAKVGLFLLHYLIFLMMPNYHSWNFVFRVKELLAWNFSLDLETATCFTRSRSIWDFAYYFGCLVFSFWQYYITCGGEGVIWTYVLLVFRFRWYTNFLPLGQSWRDPFMLCFLNMEGSLMLLPWRHRGFEGKHGLHLAKWLQLAMLCGRCKISHSMKNLWLVFSWSHFLNLLFIVFSWPFIYGFF